MIGIVCSLLLCITTANAAINCTRLTTYDGNPSINAPLRPNISCDGNYGFYISTCQPSDPFCNSQDDGSIYKVNLINGSTIRFIAGTTGASGIGITYVSSNETGDIIALASAKNLTGDLTGDYAISTQVYVSDNGTLRRLTTSFDGIRDLKPNISCDGNVVCWVSVTDGVSQAFCNTWRINQLTQITTGSRHTTSIVPNNDGTHYVVASRETLAGSFPAPEYESTLQIYFFNGSIWARKSLLEGGEPLEPRLTKDETLIVFANEPHNLRLQSGRKTACKYSFGSDLFSKIFNDSEFQSKQTVASYVSADHNGSNILLASEADLAGDVTTLGQRHVYHCKLSATDLIYQSGSPVTLRVIDPQGRCFSQDPQLCNGSAETIPGASYDESDLVGDAICNIAGDKRDCDDRITIDPRIEGTYTIDVIPDGASPNDPYSLIAVYNNSRALQISTQFGDTPEPQQFPLSVPPPQATLDLARGYVGSASGKYRLKGSFTAPEVKGSVTLTITDGTNTKTIDLGDTANYKKVSASVISTKIINGASIIRIKFKKPAFDDWQVIIKGTKLDLAMFAGTSDSTIGYELTFGGVAYTSEELFGRTGKLDLLFRVPR